MDLMRLFRLRCGLDSRLLVAVMRPIFSEIEDTYVSIFLLNYTWEEGKNGCYFDIHSPKTKAGVRQIPMTEEVKNAFLLEKKMQDLAGIQSKVTIDGYHNFIFVNRFGNVQNQGTLNRALRRIIRDCNDKQLLKEKNNPVLLPNFSCHSLRHTFTTRLVEAGMEKQTGRGCMILFLFCRKNLIA